MSRLAPRQLAFEVASLVETLWLVVLPAGRRRASARVTSLAHLPLASGLLGFAEVATGILVGLFLYLRFMHAFSDMAATNFFEQSQSDAGVEFNQRLAFNLSGAIGAVSFLVTPQAWLCIYLVVEGVVRMVTWLAGQSAVGCLAVYPVLGLAEHGLRRRRARQRAAAFGPAVPDRLEENPSAAGEWALRVTAAAEKPWRAVDTIRIGDALYELASMKEAHVDGRLRLCYELRRWPSNRLVRSIVDYEPPRCKSVPPVQPRG